MLNILCNNSECRKFILCFFLLITILHFVVAKFENLILWMNILLQNKDTLNINFSVFPTTELISWCVPLNLKLLLTFFLSFYYIYFFLWIRSKRFENHLLFINGSHSTARKFVFNRNNFAFLFYFWDYFLIRSSFLSLANFYEKKFRITTPITH